MNDAAAAPDLAVRRRLRAQPRRQPRHSRPDLARPSQCNIGDGGWPAIGRDEVAALQIGGGKQPALRDRAARHADRAVPAADDALPAARWRLVPAPSKALARAACCGGSIPRSSKPNLMAQLAAFKEAVRPRAGFRRRPPACAVLPWGARRLSAAVKEAAPDAWVRQGGRLNASGRAARRAQGAVARRSERAISPPRRRRRHPVQSRLCRRL